MTFKTIFSDINKVAVARDSLSGIRFDSKNVAVVEAYKNAIKGLNEEQARYVLSKRYVSEADQADLLTKAEIIAANDGVKASELSRQLVLQGVRKEQAEALIEQISGNEATTTEDGITCTNNGDGTYTINGTVSSKSNRAVITIQHFIDTFKEHLNEELLLVGCPKHDESLDASLHLNNTRYHAADKGNGAKFNMSGVFSTYVPITIEIGPNGATANNLVFKPMITTNLNATYDDFVPYTGDTGRLNGDVAELIKKVTFEKNNSIFHTPAGQPVIYGDTAGRLSVISDEWSNDKGRVIKFKNEKDAKTDITVFAAVPAHSALFLQIYSPDGMPVEVTSPLFFYNQSSNDIPVENIHCNVTAPIGTEVSIAFNPIAIKNI